MSGGPPREIEALLAALDEARAALLGAFEGITQEAFERPSPAPAATEDERMSVRDVLWHAGLLDDWYRLLIDQASAGGRSRCGRRVRGRRTSRVASCCVSG